MFGQVSDDFTDGDFTSNPVWSGDDSKFTVYTGRLKLNDTQAGQSYLSTSCFSINDATWEFYVRMEFNPASANCARVFLVSDQADVKSPLNGYFVSIGSASDEISLYRQTGTERVEIIDGKDNRLNKTINEIKIKVTRDELGHWELYSDTTATSTYFLEGAFQDNSHITSSYFGIQCVYTITRSEHFYFDDFVITGNPYVDTVAPEIETVTVLSASQLNLSFSEEIEATSAENILNYHVPGLGNPLMATLETGEKNVTLSFTGSFPNGIESTVNLSSIADTAGNVMQETSVPFLFFQPSPVSYRDLIITEIFADFSPHIGIPEAEFIEVFNRSLNPVDLAGWKITDESSTGILPTKILLPGEYITLTAPASALEFQTFGTTLAVSNFPALNNSGDALKLLDNNGQPVDSVLYSDDWYRDEDKKQGGWTLELIDTENTCKGDDNWAACTNETGGTPGHQNSVYANIVDTQGPGLISAIESAPDTIQLMFDEKLDGSLPSVSDITSEPPLAITSVSFADESLKSLELVIGGEVEDDRTYEITVVNISDCPGNPIEAAFSKTYLNYDTLAPVIDSINVISSTSIELYFSERVSRTAAENILNYSIGPDENPETTSLSTDEKQMVLTFASVFTNGHERTLHIENMADINGNVMNDSISFVYFEPSPVVQRDLIITEIFADPSPVIGLPEFEFVEVYNRSLNPVNLRGWIFTDGSSSTIVSADEIILPGQYTLLTSHAGSSAYESYGKTISLSNFPTINNSADALVLKDQHGLNIDSVRFSSSWFRDEDKKEGGWTLEIIDPEDVCKGENNWAASNDTIVGGTPGKQNSVYASVPDVEGPRLVSAKQMDSVNIRLDFSERLDQTLPTTPNFEFLPFVSVSEISFSDDSHKALTLTLAAEMEEGRTYHVMVKNLYDCPGNLISPPFDEAFVNLDTIAPVIADIQVKSATELEIIFSEKVEELSASDAGNYAFGKETLEPLTAKPGPDLKTVLITMNEALANGVEEVLTVRDISDINGNRINESSRTVLFFEEMPIFFKDVIITEIFPDPSPAQGLPEVEFIEIYNRSANPINLKGWTIDDGGPAATLPYALLLPQHYLIISSTSGQNLFAPFGKTAGVPNLPSLNNSSDYLVIRNRTGLVVDSVKYADTWYSDNEKKQGGFTLELIDPENTCSEEKNWKASEETIGGTPGQQNSVFANKQDLTGPFLESVVPLSANTLMVTFNEKLDKQLPGPASFSLQGFAIIEIRFTDQSLRVLEIELDKNLEQNIFYTLTINDVYDCAGNVIDKFHRSTSFALPESGEAGDVVINEILFNPRPTGIDFVEIYNRSEKFLNLKGWALANVVADSLANQKVISQKDFLFPPSSYIVFTTDENLLKGEYLSGKEETFFNMSAIPSMNDDEGSISILDSAGSMIDRFAYSDKMHSVFIKDEEGVSLERVSANEATANTANWKSASQYSGFATPGYLNSNTRSETTLDENAILIEPEIFQPHSGTLDFAKIMYNFGQGGFVANVKILDPQGREVKEIAHNEILSTEGFFRWDGDEQNGSKVRVGNYLVWFEVFDDQGNVQIFRKRVAVAVRF